MGFELADVISINDFSKSDLLAVLAAASKMEARTPEEKHSLLHSKTVATLFFEPSTRTRISFSTAIQNLGAREVGFADAKTSSTAKGESLIDTIRTIEKYAQAIVMRHPWDGAARLAADAGSIPIINAGDGSNQHPTQTLLDLYTIQKAFGRIDGLNIGMSGDLRFGRTVHSLATALTHFNVKQYHIAPESLCMPSDLKHKVAAKNKVSEFKTIEEAIPELDVLYCTRVQKERFADAMEYERVKDVFILNMDTLKDAKPTLKVMHPLPRVNEIAYEVDSSPHALYFQQLGNGLPVREALLHMMLAE